MSKGHNWILKLEGMALFLSTLFLYWYLGGGLKNFVVFVVMPDFAVAAYLFGPRVGAIVYNIFHSKVLPILLAVAGCYYADELMLSASLAWLCHIGADRMFGIGLKSLSGFNNTHLGALK
ncbi:MAG: DUF4260 domain-containing protein [Simkaniaceae bacterium]|nr:DUF4260 domain-containing protein [Simkaniaceae bacterium]